MNDIDRRNFLVLWIQMILLAWFPFLREQPPEEFRKAVEKATKNLSVEEWRNMWMHPTIDTPSPEMIGEPQAAAR
jgi:hypothetical protein